MGFLEWASFNGLPLMGFIRVHKWSAAAEWMDEGFTLLPSLLSKTASPTASYYIAAPRSRALQAAQQTPHAPTQLLAASFSVSAPILERV